MGESKKQRREYGMHANDFHTGTQSFDQCKRHAYYITILTHQKQKIKIKKKILKVKKRVDIHLPLLRIHNVDKQWYRARVKISTTQYTH